MASLGSRAKSDASPSPCPSPTRGEGTEQKDKKSGRSSRPPLESVVTVTWPRFGSACLFRGSRTESVTALAVAGHARSSRPCAFAAAEDGPDGPCGRIGLGRHSRTRREVRGFFGRSGAAATRWSCVGPAASSAVVGVRFGAPARDRLRVLREFRNARGHCGSSWLRRSGWVRPVPVVGRASQARPLTGERTTNRTPLLRFVSPAAFARHVALRPGRRHLSGRPASTVGPRRPSSFALVVAFARG